jgi:hypothetical protein
MTASRNLLLAQLPTEHTGKGARLMDTQRRLRGHAFLPPGKCPAKSRSADLELGSGPAGSPSDNSRPAASSRCRA